MKTPKMIKHNGQVYVKADEVMKGKLIVVTLGPDIDPDWKLTPAGKQTYAKIRQEAEALVKKYTELFAKDAALVGEELRGAAISCVSQAVLQGILRQYELNGVERENLKMIVDEF